MKHVLCYIVNLQIGCTQGISHFGQHWGAYSRRTLQFTLNSRVHKLKVWSGEGGCLFRFFVDKRVLTFDDLHLKKI